MAMCAGTSWIWDGFAGTLDALIGFAKPGGLIVSGEPFWRKYPPAEYCASQEIEPETFHTLAGCAGVAREKGLETVYVRASPEQEWDRYEFLQTVAFDRFARENPDHPDLEEIRTRILRSKEAYLRWGRDTLGFAFWVFRSEE